LSALPAGLQVAVEKAFDRTQPLVLGLARDRPLPADQVFAIGAFTASLTFIVAFGITKALTNLAAGSLCDRYGRKPVLVAGWLIGLPVPLLLIWAPSWWWVISSPRTCFWGSTRA
jgi:MFS family permease